MVFTGRPFFICSFDNKGEGKQMTGRKIEENHIVWLKSTLNNCMLQPRIICKILRFSNETLVKLSHLPDEIDPPIPIGNIVLNERKARAIVRKAIRKKRKRIKNGIRWLEFHRERIAQNGF